jgi:hypothetical protein
VCKRSQVLAPTNLAALAGLRERFGMHIRQLPPFSAPGRA